MDIQAVDSNTRQMGLQLSPDEPLRSDLDRLTVSVQESLEREERPTGSEADQYIEGT